MASKKKTKATLENDFAQVAKQINDKIKQAAKNLKEANQLVLGVGLSGLGEDARNYDNTQEQYDMRDQIDTSPLYKAMDDAGWQTSSFGC